MDTGGTLVTGLLYQFSAALNLLTHLGVLVFGLAVVRSRHPAAGLRIAGAAGMMVLSLLLWHAFPFLVSWFGGMGRLHWWYAAGGVVSAIWGTAAWALLVWGVLGLCRAIPRPVAASAAEAAPPGAGPAARQP